MIDLRNLDPKYKIRDNETDEDYELRICSYHDSDKIVWEDIAFIINSQTGNEKTESTYRKGYKLYQKGVQAMLAQKEPDLVLSDIEDTSGSAPEDSTDELTDEDLMRFLSMSTGLSEEDIRKHQVQPGEVFSEAEKEELKARYFRNVLRTPALREVRQESRFERFYGEIAKVISIMDPPEYLGTNTILSKNKREYVLTLADLHIGAKFKSVNNEYSLDIVADRFNILLNRLIDFITEKEICKLKIVSLGDIVQGILRITDVRLNEVPVVEAFVFACRLISEFLNKLSAYCSIEFIQVCYSNHDQLRMLGSKANEFASEDMGKILHAYLTDVLAHNNRVSIIADTEKDYAEFNIFKFSCIAMHGHQIRNVMTASKDLANRQRKFYDYVFLGHTHSAKEIITSEGADGDCHDNEILVAPSFVGSDPYADKLMVGSKPSCKLYEFDEKYGHIASYKIILN